MPQDPPSDFSRLCRSPISLFGIFIPLFKVILDPSLHPVTSVTVLSRVQIGNISSLYHGLMTTTSG